MGFLTRLFSRKGMSGGGSVCLLIDFENFAISLKNMDANADWSIAPVVKMAANIEGSNAIAISRAYADWSYFRKHTEDLIRHGIQVVQAPSHRLQGKNATDIQMAVEATDLMHQRRDLRHFVLLTGDSDFNPLVHLLRSRGKRVIGVGIRGTVSPYFEKVCDQFYYFDDLTGAPELPLPVEKQRTRPTPAARAKSTPVKSAPGKRTRSAPPAPEPAKPAVVGDQAKALEILGLDADFRIPPARMRELIPSLIETVREASPTHVSDMKKVLQKRFSGKITPHEAAVLANLFKRVQGYGTTEETNWLEHVRPNGEDAFDILLAAASDTLASAQQGGTLQPVQVAEILFGETVNSSEMRTRMARGRKLFHDLKGMVHR